MLNKKNLFLLFIPLFLSINAFFALYLFPNNVVLEEVDVQHPSIPTSFNGFKLAQISDLHLGFYDSDSQRVQLLQMIEKSKPDVVVFTGDLFDNPDDPMIPIDTAINFLSSIEAPFGKYAVYGNHDFGVSSNGLYEEIMNQAGFTVLINSSEPLTLLNGDKIFIAGLDDIMLGLPDVNKTVKNIPEDAFSILLAHEPDIADVIATTSISMQLSGHSHGGQVRIPFIKPIITPPKGTKYVNGSYNIEKEDDETLLLYVNRGIGMTRLPIRYFSFPELTLFTLRNASAQ
ncbi:metallophosphoesterase [Mangrovibacillus cuniculi]|uniref:Metallophosphoesterase n=1 Tax=Mangrovibacillus cuniculi TaxID=2593652 RepID=A0A7S8CA11_9BACI|nr:metallophosphoesterase [Mangrovibacillus cuniculi]QPC46171.1 metallophosphoesterase [Mangrovibacillus cuniculi]